MPHVHRIGFTQIGDKGSRDRQYRINIIFVHGARGHPKETWEDDDGAGSGLGSAGSSERRGIKAMIEAMIKAIFRPGASGPADSVRDEPPAKVFWPHDYLADDIPEARIWTYGYEANNRNSVSQHGRDLSVKVERDINNEDPIVFVAHCLGSIIVKDAINRSEECRARTKLIVFLGTPYCVCSLAGVNREVLDNIILEFKEIVYGGNIRIHSFYESRGTSGMKGLHNKVVDDFSSELDLPQATETIESIDADHMQMARCRSRDDAQYRAVVGVLREFLRSYFDYTAT